MKKSYLLIIFSLIVMLLFSSCKVEFPEQPDDYGSIPTTEQSEITSTNEITQTDDTSVQSATTNDNISSKDNESKQTTSSNGNTLSSSEDKGTKSAESATASDSTKQNTSNENDKYQTDPIPDGKQKPVEPQDKIVDEDKRLTATLSITCKTILSNMDKFNKDKMSVLPADGVIYAERTIVFYEGESVFDVLVRETKKNRIHMEFENTPIYNSAYIEGIHNLYEFDCGDLSGWMYKVNGWFPNYGCSRYQLKAGDKIEWVYTCDLGRDVGCEWLDKTK